MGFLAMSGLGHRNVITGEGIVMERDCTKHDKSLRGGKMGVNKHRTNTSTILSNDYGKDYQMRMNRLKKHKEYTEQMREDQRRRDYHSTVAVHQRQGEARDELNPPVHRPVYNAGQSAVDKELHRNDQHPKHVNWEGRDGHRGRGAEYDGFGARNAFYFDNSPEHHKPRYHANAYQAQQGDQTSIASPYDGIDSRQSMSSGLSKHTIRSGHDVDEHSLGVEYQPIVRGRQRSEVGFQKPQGPSLGPRQHKFGPGVRNIITGQGFTAYDEAHFDVEGRLTGRGGRGGAASAGIDESGRAILRTTVQQRNVITGKGVKSCDEAHMDVEGKMRGPGKRMNQTEHRKTLAFSSEYGTLVDPSGPGRLYTPSGSTRICDRDPFEDGTVEGTHRPHQRSVGPPRLIHEPGVDELLHKYQRLPPPPPITTHKHNSRKAEQFGHNSSQDHISNLGTFMGSPYATDNIADGMDKFSAMNVMHVNDVHITSGEKPIRTKTGWEFPNSNTTT